MRLCPSCGNQYSDDANFCPMDATKLPPPAAATAPQAPVPAAVAPPDAATVMDGAASAIAGRYLVMGGGGRATPTGAQHEARDTNHGGALVGLKLVRPEVLPTPTMADRALRELKQLSKVSSERIVRVVDQGKHGSEVYIATEAVNAPTLEDLITREGPLPIERATQIVLQVGEALTEAQKVGVIHRDVAPRNVYVLTGDKVKVGDFGLAEPVSDKVFGAPAFISPEQVEGKAVDQRSNIYSLGAVFYYALTGHPPFQGDAASLLQQHLSSTPQAPSTQRSGVPSELDRIILKALEKSGGRRHLTLRQLLSEIEAAGNAARAAAPAPSSDDVASKRTVMGFAAPNVAARGDSTVMGMQNPRPTAPMAAAPATTPSMPAITTPSMPAITTPNMPAAAPATTPTMPVAAEAKTMMAQPAPNLAPPPAAPEANNAKTVMAMAAPQVSAPPPSAPPPAAEPQARTVMAAAPQPAGGAPTTVDKKAFNAPDKVQQAVAVAQAQVAAQKAAAQAAAPPPKSGFRETAWFKAGEIQEELEKAQAQASAATGGDVLAPAGTTGSHAVVGGEVDMNKVDVTAADKARLSLKTGSTQMMPAITAPKEVVKGERMDEMEMLAEINTGKRRLMIAGLIVVAVIGLVVAYFMLFAKGEDKKTEAPAAPPTAVAAAPPTAPPTTAAPAAPAAPPGTAAPPAATAAAPAAPPPAPAAPTPKSPNEMLADAAQAAQKGANVSAVELLTEAHNAGADGKREKAVLAQVEKAVAKQLAAAKKRKDKEGLEEAKNLQTRLKSLKGAKKKK